jgi:hypothetical protein
MGWGASTNGTAVTAEMMLQALSSFAYMYAFF